MSKDTLTLQDAREALRGHICHLGWSARETGYSRPGTASAFLCGFGLVTQPL